MESIQTAWQDLRIFESILLQRHRDLLQYSDKDERHRGQWKALDHHVAAFDVKGKASRHPVLMACWNACKTGGQQRWLVMIIATVNQKGGVGKSTITVPLTNWFRER